MNVQTTEEKSKKKENDFLDFMIAVGVSGGLLFMIFIGLTVVELVAK